MIGIIAGLLVSWLLTMLIYKKDLSVLGLTPTRSRLIDLAFGFTASALICSLYYFLISLSAGNKWVINEDFTSKDWLYGSWWTLKSVLFEELLFRGALLYITIRIMGINKACMLSAACFGIYHWFSYNAWGNPFPMFIIFLITFVAGLMFAYAYAKTDSLHLPIALHFGWNIFTIVVFSSGPLGKQFLTTAGENKAGVLLSLLLFVFQVFALPVLVYFYLKQLKKKKCI